MAKEQPIIIKKKKGGAHGGAHGGAWKVAYADFVTAMMCFFLVMWLMGSDEETKSSIAHYFNHPNTPWKAGGDPKSNEVHPMGEKEGSGDSVVNGLDGFWPSDLIEQPRAERNLMKENKSLSRMIEDLLEGKVYGMDVDPNHVKFSLSDRVLFKAGTAELMPEATKDLDLLGQLLKGFTGYIVIEGHTDNSPVKSPRYTNNWELSMGRALTVMDYLTKKSGIPEAKIFPKGMGARRTIASNESDEGRAKNRRVEFILSYERP